MNVALHQGRLEDVLPTLAAESVDAVITDTPYHLTAGKKGGSGRASVNLSSPAGRSLIGTGFMGMTWDGGDVAFRVETWQAVFRVLKPGAHLLAFGGTRTHHRLVCAIEDAGFEIRDEIDWLFGSGFPKSLNLEGEWDGWGTALKPAKEPICFARKPLIGTVNANVAAHGTGAINIDGCRVPVVDASYAQNCSGDRGHADNRDRKMDFGMTAGAASAIGRWPANVIHDGSEEVLAAFPQAGGAQAAVTGEEPSSKVDNVYNPFNGRTATTPRIESETSAARFFYCAKASRADRDHGCEMLELLQRDLSRKEGDPGGDNPRNRGVQLRHNFHPTVKPTALMRYLARLVTPPGGTVIDPFMGSGSTGRGAVLEGFNFVGIEMTAEYMPIAKARIAAAERMRDEEIAEAKAAPVQHQLGI